MLFLLLFNFVPCFGDGELSTSFIISGNDSIKGNTEPNNKDIVSENNSKDPNYEGIIFILIVGGIIALIVILVVSENKKCSEAIKKYPNEYNFISKIQYIEPPSRISPALADTILLYARALGINNASIEHYINELIITAKRASERDRDSLNYINRTYYFNYYLIHMNTMNSIYNNATPSNDDSGGGFTGGLSGGGGGGGSGAFLN